MAPTRPAIPARGRWRASQASCLSMSVVATLRLLQRPARRLGRDLVAPGHARHAVAGEQEEVEHGRGEADEALDPPAPLALREGEMGHCAAIVDSPAC